jgi:hypothetical protein
MIARELMSANDAKLGCVNCGASEDNLNPKASGESGVYTCQCEVCGYRDLYIMEEDESQGVG